MKRIVLCGYNHHHYLEMVQAGFERSGVEVEVFEHPRLTVEKLATRNPLRRLVKGRPLHDLNRRLLALCEAVQPDGVLFINGEAILAETLRALEGRVQRILWAVDAIDNVQVPREHLPLFDCRVFFTPGDVAAYDGQAALSYGFDESVYRPLGLSPAYDVGFVGAPHEERLPMLEELAVYMKGAGLTLGIWGPSWFSSRSTGGRDPREAWPNLCASVVADTSLSPTEVNTIYNQSRMVLNIHAEQCRGCLNPRTYEILGSGALCLVDDKPEIDLEFVRNEELVPWRSMSALCAIIGELASDPERCQAIARQGHQKALANHTFTHRAATICQLVSG